MYMYSLYIKLMWLFKNMSMIFQRDSNQLTVMSLDSITRDMKVESAPSLVVPVINFDEPHDDSLPPNKSFFTMTPQEIAHWIDRRSRILFPLAFIIFNCFYWTFVWFWIVRACLGQSIWCNNGWDPPLIDFVLLFFLQNYFVSNKILH